VLVSLQSYITMTLPQAPSRVGRARVMIAGRNWGLGIIDIL